MLWSAAVKRKNGGLCVMVGYDDMVCWSQIDAAHDFPKGADPAVRYDVDFGHPLCRGHHQRYGNGERWRWFLFRWWGPELYAERYAAAHTSRRKLDLAAVKRELSA